MYLTTDRVPVITIVQLVYLSRYTSSLNDQTWSNTTPWILTQVVMNTSIMSACTPSLRRVVTELRTHQTGVTISQGMEFGTVQSGGKSKTYATGKSNSHISGSHASRLKHSTNPAQKDDEEQGEAMPYGHNPPYDKPKKALTSISAGKRSPEWQSEAEERSSQEMLREKDHDNRGITRTVDYRVEEDDQITKSSDGEHEVGHHGI